MNQGPKQRTKNRTRKRRSKSVCHTKTKKVQDYKGFRNEKKAEQKKTTKNFPTAKNTFEEETTQKRGRGEERKSNVRVERRSQSLSRVFSSNFTFSALRNAFQPRTPKKIQAPVKLSNWLTEIHVQKGKSKEIPFARRQMKDSQLQKGINDLHVACRIGQVKALSDLIRKGYDINVRDESYNSGLHIAVTFNNYLCVKTLLLNRDINCNIVNNQGDIPLHIAARKGYDKIVKELIKKGRSNLTIKSEVEKEIPSDFPKNSAEVSEAFSDQEDVEKDFLRAVKDSDLEAVQKLLKTADINQKNEDKENALLLSVKKPNNFSMVKLLCNNRIEIDKVIMKKSLPEYLEFLQQKYRQRKRDQVIMEIFQTEKTYMDDLELIFEIFIKRFNSVFLRKSIRKMQTKTKMEKLINRLKDIRVSNRAFIKKLVRIIPVKEGFSNHSKIISQLTKINYEAYKKCILKELVVSDQIKEKKHLSEFKKKISELEKLIPYPKIQGFYSLLGRPRNRLIKYKDLTKRMLSYTKVGDKCYKNLKQYVENVEKILRLINDETGEIKNRMNIVNVHKRALDRFYKLPSNIFLLHDNEKSKKRKYVNDELDLKCLDMKTGCFVDLDLFLFSDLIIIGKRGKSLRTFFYCDTKIIFIVNFDCIRVKIFVNYKKDKSVLRNPIVDFMCKSKTGTKWVKVISDNILNENDENYYINKAQFKLENNLEKEEEYQNFIDQEITKDGKKNQLSLNDLKKKVPKERKVIPKLLVFEKEKEKNLHQGLTELKSPVDFNFYKRMFVSGDKKFKTLFLKEKVVKKEEKKPE